MYLSLSQVRIRFEKSCGRVVFGFSLSEAPALVLFTVELGKCSDQRSISWSDLILHLLRQLFIHFT